MPTRPPPINGLMASTLQLPAGDWATVLDCLCARFQTIDRARWVDRIRRGRVIDQHGVTITAQRRHQPGLRVHYYREVAAEPAIPFAESILHADADLVVADKPHFLPVTPSGGYVEQTLLARLIRRLGNPQLVPLHRIDRGTAGLVLFSANPASRTRYQALFQQRQIVKHYEAIAPALPGLVFPLTRATRLVAGTPFFRMCEGEGAANTETRIDVLDRRGAQWRYALSPLTGRKHQLRVHMAALGAPIVNDSFYPTLVERAVDDYSRPLGLLARSLAFVDPLTGRERRFDSQRRL